MDCGCLIEPCFGLHPDHIADADKKAQPASAPCSGCCCEHDEIHNPTDTCATCNGGSGYHTPKPAPAPLPSYTFDSHTHALKFIAASLTDLGGEQEALDTVCAHISDLTRRLAEVGAERDGYSAKANANCVAWMETKDRAEAAEARVREAKVEREALREALQELLAASHPIIHRGRRACEGRVRAKRLARVALAATEAK